MALYKIEDFNPNYRQDAFDGEDVKGLDVYAGRTDDKIGTIDDVLVDETGRFRYLVIDTGFWIFGKKVLLPVGRCHIDVDRQRVYAIGLANKDQAERLPEYDDRMTVDYDYEERVRHVYRTPAVGTSAPTGASVATDYTPPVERSVPVDTSVPVEASGLVGISGQAGTQRPATYDRNTYTYEREPALYQMNQQEHEKLRLYEERLVASKNRRKTGEVEIGKRVETETIRASVPVEKERLIIERDTPTDVRTTVNPGDADFREGEVAHVEIYEETADIRKQPFVHEEVTVRKEVVQDTVDTTETVRREELDVNTKGRPVVKRPNQRSNNP